MIILSLRMKILIRYRAWNNSVWILSFVFKSLFNDTLFYVKTHNRSQFASLNFRVVNWFVFHVTCY
jgi:hypothetical protein